MQADGPVLVAPDSFKGTFSSAAVAQALGAGLRRAGLEVDLCPAADGGEGTLDVLLDALGGEARTAPAHDPLGRPLVARWGLVPAGAHPAGDISERERPARDAAGGVGGEALALVETAAASGLALVDPSERDACAASSAGTGELIAAAAAAGARTIAVGVGGSATTDGGAGALEAIERGGGLRGARLVVLCDVRTPFERAAEVFAPQKGADAATVEALAARLDALAARFPRDPRGVPMTGAAGGLSGGLWAALDATLEAGAAWVLNALDIDARLQRARAVVSGEGRLDAQTGEGKLVGELSTRAARAGVPLHVVAGRCELAQHELARLGVASAVEASTLKQVEASGESLGRALADVR
jgi:glycerate kinase